MSSRKNTELHEYVSRVFEAVDSMDEEQLLAFLTQKATFIFANAEPVIGRTAIGHTVKAFMSMIQAIHHELIEVWSCDETIIARLTVTYTRQDGERLTFPAATIWKMDGALISHYQIYVDNSPLFVQDMA